MAPARRVATPGARGGRLARALIGGEGLSLLGEMLATCLAVAVLSVPLVTVLPALAAGCRHLNRFIDAEESSYRMLLADFWQAFTKGWGLVWSPLASLAIALAGVDLALWAEGRMTGPAGFALAAVAAAALAFTLVVALWAAQLWEGGSSWREVTRVALQQARADVPGSAWLLVAVALTCVFVWMLPVLVLFSPGLWCFAAVATDRRERHR
ncbi:MAG: hypothetical protein LBE08_13130 [Bifidobacteriaceae bacterium]|jgi:hypothetical protein|nr:hypothetical protein [Bifidobacteriaceae bacterium]